MITIFHERRVAGVLTSYAGLPSATIFRWDTEQEYVAQMDMTLDSVGKYSYQFADLGLDFEYKAIIKDDSDAQVKEFFAYGETDIRYNSNTELDAYFEDHLWADSWLDLNRLKKLWVSKEATLRLDALAFHSEKTLATQSKAFPRNGNTTIPTAVKSAHADICLKLSDGVIPEEEMDKLHVSRESYAGASTTFNTRSSGKPWIASGILSEDAWVKLVPYMLNSSAIEMVRA